MGHRQAAVLDEAVDSGTTTTTTSTASAAPSSGGSANTNTNTDTNNANTSMNAAGTGEDIVGRHPFPPAPSLSPSSSSSSSPLPPPPTASPSPSLPAASSGTSGNPGSAGLVSPSTAATADTGKETSKETGSTPCAPTTTSTTATTMATTATAPLRSYSDDPYPVAAAPFPEPPTVARLEAQLRDARIRASEAEEMSRARGQACENLRQEIAILERKATDFEQTTSTTWTASNTRAPSEGMAFGSGSNAAFAAGTTTTTTTASDTTPSDISSGNSSSYAGGWARPDSAAPVAAAQKQGTAVREAKIAGSFPPGLEQPRAVETHDAAAINPGVYDQQRTMTASAARADVQAPAAAPAAAGGVAAGAEASGGRGADLHPYGGGGLLPGPLLRPLSPPGTARNFGNRGSIGARSASAKIGTTATAAAAAAAAAGAAASSSFGTAAVYKEAGRRSRAKSVSPDIGYGASYEDVRCAEIPVGRHDEGLLLGGGRVLHKLKEEFGGTLEYRRSQGIVCVYGQRGSTRKAAACVRSAMLLRDARGQERAEEYALARLCMDDLLAECIALKGEGRKSAANSSGSGNSNAIGGLATTSPASSSDEGGCESAESWRPSQLSTTSTSTTITAPSSFPCSSASSSSASSSFTPSLALASSRGGMTPAAAAAAAARAAAAANAAVVAVSVASNLPDGEYPPETSSLRIIGEKFGCVIDVVGEAASASANAAVAASAAAAAAARDAALLLRAVGSVTPVGNQDVLIWGPVGVVDEAKDAVCALVSGRASAEVVVGVGRIGRRDRGFWVNCETMAAGPASLEVDHKRGVVTVRGCPKEVEEGRKEFQNKLASLFPGDFLAVPMPRAALKDLANSRGLASAAAHARIADEQHDSTPSGSDCCDEAGGVELWADWPFSCVRLRGEPATVRRAAKALYANLTQWNTLEVSVRVDRGIVTRLLSRSGRILAGISSNMGITLLVEREKGVLRGRARTEEDAKEANRVLKLKVAALSQRRSEQANAAAAAAAAAAVATTAAAPASKVVVRPGLPPSSSACSEDARSVLAAASGGGSGPAGLELTDAFQELQAFFGGEGDTSADVAPSEGMFPASSTTKRSCVFDGVEDVLSGHGLAVGNTAKGFGNQRNGVTSRATVVTPVATSSGTGRGGGPVRVAAAASTAAVAAVAAAGPGAKSGPRSAAHDHQQPQLQHVVQANHRGVIIHRPAVSPRPHSAPDPVRSSSPMVLSDDGGFRRSTAAAGGLIHYSHHHNHSAFRYDGGASGPSRSPSPTPSPTRVPLTLADHHFAHHAQQHQHQQRLKLRQDQHQHQHQLLRQVQQRQQQQQQQYHSPSSDGPSSWSMLPEEPKLVRHHTLDSFTKQQQQQQQQQHKLLVMGRRSSSQTGRDAIGWGNRAEEMGVVSSSYDRRLGHLPPRGGGGSSSGPEDYVYHLSPIQGETDAGYPRTPLRVESPAGYVLPPPSHAVPSGGSEHRGYGSVGAGSADSGGSAFMGHGFTATYAGGGAHDEYEKDAMPRRDELDHLARWKSEDASCYSTSAMSRSYSFSASASAGAAGAAGYGAGAGGGPSTFGGGSVSRIRRW